MKVPIPIPVKGIDLRTGMVVYPNEKLLQRESEKLPQVTGRCNHGIHFGKGCYDTISTWWIAQQEGK